MSQNLEKLKSLLAELFQLDQTDLDFGIYRIMNAKRDEITRFLENDLLPQVREVLSAYESESRATLKEELEKAKEQAKALGFADPSQAPKVKELEARYNAAFDIEAAESEVFSHLYNFFRRYYSEGDFISQRRYKEGVYAIPYEGEEVKLYWANHDQYYIKTSEYLRNYTFKLPSGRRVHFKLVEADTEKDNNRAPNGNERRFILSQEQPLAEENGELVIRFEYRPDPAKRTQADLNAEASQRIADIISQSPGLRVSWSPLLEKSPTEKNPNRTLLEKHLTDYTARNTFDYFIHKDLGGFLRRELDFYIKNEVMHLDDVESETAPRVEQYLSKIKAIRRIAHKIIDFLAQIENFQKKLWLKKKFVVETQYCVTLDRILRIEDEETRHRLIGEIIKNDAQREEWVRLFAINEIEANLTQPGYTEPLEPEFLQAHPTLVVDTRHFGEAFKLRLLAAIPDLDEETDGMLIHSENFQALNLLQARYREQVKCIYIDPPYNTAATQILYKNDYPHASWLSLMQNRLLISIPLLTLQGIVQVAIDDMEFHRLEALLRGVFGSENYLANVAIMHNPKGRDQDHIATAHEYTLIAAKDIRKAVTHRLRLGDDELIKKFAKLDGEQRYRELPLRRSGSGASREDRPYMYYPFVYNEQEGVLGVISREEYEQIYQHGRFNDEFVERLRKKYTESGFVFILPVREDGSLGRWRWGYETSRDACTSGVLFVKEVGGRQTVYQRDDADMTFLPKSLWYGERYDASTKGTNLLRDIIGTSAFDYPKSLWAVYDMVTIGCGSKGIVLDYFAGSGTTGHAVINLNREDGGRRKFILVEMGDYFDTVLVPRIKKVIFTPEWKDGKPKRMATPEEAERSPRILKILRLESYEDTLNNLELKRTEAQQTLLEQHPEFREDYMLRYMLDVESRGSASLLNIDRFEDPFSYKLEIATGTAGETKPTVVDLVETFNYLIGLRVKTMDDVRGVRVVTGLNPQGERVLILWRNTKDMDNDKLDEWFQKQGYNTRDQEYDVIYVNGDNSLENLRKPDQTWKVRLIEEEFRRLMFDVADL